MLKIQYEALTESQSGRMSLIFGRLGFDYVKTFRKISWGEISESR